VSHLLQDLRYTLRALRNSPGFTLVALLTLALGIGANTAIFSFVDGVLLNPLPYPEPERIVRVLEKRPDGGYNGISTLNYLDWKNQNTVFEYMAGQSGWGPTLTGVDQPMLLHAARVSPHYFDIEGIKPALGRNFREEEDQPGKDKVVILTHALWESRFGSDPAIVGRAIRLDDEPYQVIGVMPGGTVFDRTYAQLWKPLAFEPSNMTRNFHWFGALAKLKPGVSLEQARTQMEAIGARIAQAYPDSNQGWSVGVEPLAKTIVGDGTRASLYVLLGAVGMVLLIGCANLANLALARGLSREREVAVRAALGAGRWRLIRQFLTENVILSVAGGALGIGIGYVCMRGLKLLIPPFTLPAEADVTLNLRVLLFSLAISVLTGILFGMAPALQASSPDLSGTMKESGRSNTSSRSSRRLRDVLVVAEIALAFVLLVGSGLLLRSFSSLLHVDPGFDSTNVLTMGLPIAQTQYPDPARLNLYLREIQAGIESVPGVRRAAVTSALPLPGWGYGMPFQIAGQPELDRAHRPGGFFKMVSPSYFETLGIKLSRGRVLNQHDTQGAPPVTVINETFAKKYFPGQDPIGKRVRIQEVVPGKTELGPEIPWEIVGVIVDEKVSGLNDVTSGGFYVSNQQSPVYGVGLVVRGNLNPSALQKSIRQAVDGVNKDQALSDIRTLDELKTQSLGPDRLGAMLLAVFAGIALLLAAIGIYGVISYSVVQRTHEIGIRAALGASRGNLLRMVLVNGLTLMLIGLALGIAGSFAVTRLLSSLLFGIGARDPLTIAAVAVVLAFVSLAACLIPALRAARVDPLVALRYE
jgi:putative ABC transport system permease protein